MTQDRVLNSFKLQYAEEFCPLTLLATSLSPNPFFATTSGRHMYVEECGTWLNSVAVIPTIGVSTKTGILVACVRNYIGFLLGQEEEGWLVSPYFQQVGFLSLTMIGISGREHTDNWGRGWRHQDWAWCWNSIPRSNFRKLHLGFTHIGLGQPLGVLLYQWGGTSNITPILRK